MTLRHRLPLLLLSQAAFAVSGRGQPAPDVPSPPQAPATLTTTFHATTLQQSKTVTFGDGEFIAWQRPAVCDAAGNVFFIRVPAADPRDVKSGVRQYTKGPSDIVRVSTEGKKTIIRPDTFSLAANADVVRTVSIAADQSGTLHALLWIGRGETGSQYLVALDEKGRITSKVELVQDEMFAHRFEFFGSGAALVRGVRPYAGSRVAILSPGGGSFRDVSALTKQDRDLSATPLQSLDPVAAGGDGRIYFVPHGLNDSVYVIDQDGESHLAFEPTPMPRDYRLDDVRAAGQRLALTYREPLADDKARFWIGVYDVTLGERLALYGPASRPPMCYAYGDGEDRFTVMPDMKSLVTLSSRQ